MRGKSSSKPSAEFEIQDLSDRHRGAYFACLEEWSEEMTEAGDHKARWFDRASRHGLRVKLAIDTNDRPIGMIQYQPIEESFADGEHLYLILCIWVHGYPEGVGDWQGQGIGEALLAAAEDDVRQLGGLGMAAWGLRLPVWMKASWFKKHGYRRADRKGIAELVWKPFEEEAQQPRWLDEQRWPIDGVDATPGVTGFISGWCPALNLVFERAKRAAAETHVRFETIDTSDPAVMRRYGRTDQVLVGGKPLQRGAPPSYDRVLKRVAREARSRS